MVAQPKLDHIQLIEQKTISSVTEIYDYLHLLFIQTEEPHASITY